MAQYFAGKESFTCAACGEDYAHETTVAECRVCHRFACNECINEQGICVPCEDKMEQPSGKHPRIDHT